MVGFYEAPDGENEALFIADKINKYLREATSEHRDDARTAVLYRTNSQSRLVEEALRRYGISTRWWADSAFTSALRFATCSAI